MNFTQSAADDSTAAMAPGHGRDEDDWRIGDYLDSHAARHPDRVALRDARASLSYAQLHAEVERCARAMLAIGLESGQRIAVLAQPRNEALITFLAAARLGLTWMGLNPRYQLPEMEYAIGDARPVALFGIDRLEDRRYEAEIESLRRQPSLRHFIGFDGGASYDTGYAQWIAGGSDLPDTSYRRALDATEASADALMVYTSGSSGKPKGVLLNQRSLVRRSRNQIGTYRPRDVPKVVNPFPINHIGGMHWVGLYTFIGGGELIYVDRFQPDEVVEMIERGEVSVLYCAPTILHMIMQSPNYRPALWDKLDWVAFSGAAMPADMMKTLFAARCRVGLSYGMTETTGSVTYCIADRDGNNLEQMTRTIGVASPPGEVRIVNLENGDFNDGAEGEIQVRAEFCLSGYFERDDANRAAFTADGWFRTGDLGRCRADGHIEFTGRISEMYKSGGYNVYPKEVEQCIELHPDITLAAVVPLPDDVYGEVGHAFACAKENAAITADELKHWLRNRLANYKIPKRISIVAELPLLPIGKVDKSALKRQASAL